MISMIIKVPKIVFRVVPAIVLAMGLLGVIHGCSKDGGKQHALVPELSGVQVVVSTEPQFYSWWVHGKIRNPLPDPVVDVVVELVVEGKYLVFPIELIRGRDSEYFEFTFYHPSNADPSYRLSVKGRRQEGDVALEASSLEGIAILPQ